MLATLDEERSRSRATSDLDDTTSSMTPVNDALTVAAAVASHVAETTYTQTPVADTQTDRPCYSVCSKRPHSHERLPTWTTRPHPQNRSTTWSLLQLTRCRHTYTHTCAAWLCTGLGSKFDSQSQHSCIATLGKLFAPAWLYSCMTTVFAAAAATSHCRHMHTYKCLWHVHSKGWQRDL